MPHVFARKLLFKPELECGQTVLGVNAAAWMVLKRPNNVVHRGGNGLYFIIILRRNAEIE